MIRDDELRRLELYAESMGLRVSWRKHKEGLPGALWVNEDTGIVLVMYTWPGQSKTMLILNFIHELAHHLAYVYNNRSLSPSVDRAFSVEDEEDLTENQRRIIYETERDDARFRMMIVKELDIKIPEWKIQLDIEVDTWFYYRFYKDGVYPTFKEMMEKKKELKGKYES